MLKLMVKNIHNFRLSGPMINLLLSSNKPLYAYVILTNKDGRLYLKSV